MSWEMLQHYGNCLSTVRDLLPFQYLPIAYTYANSIYHILHFLFTRSSITMVTSYLTYLRTFCSFPTISALVRHSWTWDCMCGWIHTLALCMNVCTHTLLSLAVMFLAQEPFSTFCHLFSNHFQLGNSEPIITNIEIFLLAWGCGSGSHWPTL